MIRRSIVMVLVLLAARSAVCATVPIFYQIDTSGTGQGVELVTVSSHEETVSAGHCDDCKGGDCLVALPGIPSVFIPDMMLVAPNETNLHFQLSVGGGTYVQIPGWGWTSAPCLGGTSGGGQESGGDVWVPAGCIKFFANVKLQFIPQQFCLYTPILGRGCPAVGDSRCGLPDSATLTVTYKRRSQHAIKSCSQSGTAPVEADGR